MRVMQVMAGAEYGGAEAFFTRLAIALHKAGLSQRVVIRKDEGRAALLQDAGIAPVQLSFGGPLDLKTKMSLKREIKKFEPDVVMTWMSRATQKCPRGKFVHVARLGGYYDTKYYQHCDQLVGNTHDIVGYLTNEGWPSEKVTYLPNFVTEEKMPSLDRKRFYTPETAPLVLAMGRLHENKAFDTLLQAVARVPNVYLWIAGEGPLRGELESMAEQLAVKPRVRFLGWRNDTPAMLATSDIFVCPSRHEPLGNVVIEAWAQSVPVITADSLGPGTLIDHMKTGMLVPVDDAKEMGNSIKYMVDQNDFRANIAKAGRAAYEANYTESMVIERYIKYFEEIVTEDIA
ncbi:MAG: glycosyltransferase [Rhodospirillales bacterium]|jgi:glycosyltransferase involved in cell wall biosynthesis|nr:glycosyltransferase [Rhodospirillales bacterium]MBT8003598.1 glycosyltransferase [Rhodospirillales bacterium]